MLKPPSQTTQNLIRARELIADEKNWCQDQVFDGHRMCAMGAVLLATGFNPGRAVQILHEAAHAISPRAIASEVNDQLGHAAVMDMFDLAIANSLAEADTSC